MSIELDPSVTDAPCGPRIAFLGVGHAGVQLITHLPQKVPELIYAAIDTDLSTLNASPFETKFLVGKRVSGGLGSGSNAEMARKCAEEDAELWEPWLEQVDVLIMACGLGGGTGGGIGPLVAERARAAGVVVIAAVVKPLEAEGGHRRHTADSALSDLREFCNAVCLFPLDSMRKDSEEEDLPLLKVVERCGQEVARSLGGLALLLRSGWVFPLTLQDLIQVMQRADGACRIAAVSAEGEERLGEAMDELFSHPLLERGTLLTQSGGIVMGILAGTETTVRELENITKEVRGVLRADAELKIGIALDERYASRLAIVMMVAERWSSRSIPLSVVAEPETPAGEQGVEGETGGNTLVQGEIKLDANSSGRFKNIEPTIEAGEDLDTPSFIRQGIVLAGTRSSRR